MFVRLPLHWLTGLLRKFNLQAGCKSLKVDTSIFPHSRMIPLKKASNKKPMGLSDCLAVEGIFNLNEIVSLSKCWSRAFLGHAVACCSSFWESLALLSLCLSL